MYFFGWLHSSRPVSALAPQQPAGIRGQPRQLVRTGVDDNPVPHDHRSDPQVASRTDAACGLVGFVLGERGPPLLDARTGVQADDLRSVDQRDGPPVGGRVQRRVQLGRLAAAVHLFPLDVIHRAAAVGLGRGPQPLARGGFDSHDADLRAVEHRQNQLAVVMEDFARPLGAGVGLHDFAGAGVQLHDRSLIPQRHVDPVVHRDQPLLHVQRNIAGPRVEPNRLPFAPAPAADGHFPQQRAVERVAGDQKPLVRQRVLARQADRSLVDDGEQAALGGHQRADAGIRLVAPQPPRTALPLQMLGRTDHAILGDRIAVGPVQVVRPLVDAVRPGLAPAAPGIVGLGRLKLPLAAHAQTRTPRLRQRSAVGRCPIDKDAPQRRQHAANLLRSHAGGSGGSRRRHDHQVHQVAGVRQSWTLPDLNRYAPVQARVAHPTAQNLALRRVGGQAMHHEAAGFGQGHRQLGIGRFQHRDHAARDAAGTNQPIRRGFGRRNLQLGGGCRGNAEQGQSQQGRHDQHRRADA